MEGSTISFIGVLFGLTISIVMIIRKLNPVSAMYLGAICGAVIGGASLAVLFDVVIIEGGRMVKGIIVRIIAGGVLAGVLIESGAAESIARGIVEKLGEKRVLIAMTLASAIILAVGVFLPVSVVILAPIALSVAHKANISKFAAILALSGGAKAGNIISPNPNTIAAAESFNLPLSQVMIGGLIPGLAAFAATIFLCNMVQRKGEMVTDDDLEKASEAPDAAHVKAKIADIGPASTLPPFNRAIVAPVVAIGLLMISPILGIFGITFQVDAFFVLPFGAIVGAIAMGKGRNIIDYTNKGVTRMAPVVLMLAGAGALSGLIINSDFPALILSGMAALGIPTVFLAPISGTIMGSATGSAATGVIIAGSAFNYTLLNAGVSAISAAVMIHAGAGFLDIVPHGNYFLASQSSMKVSMIDRIKVMPYEALVGGVMTLVATIVYGFILR